MSLVLIVPHVLLVPPIPATAIAPSMMASWLSNQLRNLGKFSRQPIVQGDESHQNDREYHRFARTFPFVGTWEQAQQVATSYDVVLVPSPSVTLDPTEVGREKIEQALLGSVNAFFGVEASSKREALRLVAALECEPGSVLSAKKSHPVLEALQWISIVEDSKLVEFVRQYVIIVDSVQSV